MSDILIPGLGSVKVNPYETTSEHILNTYRKWMEAIQSVFERPTAATGEDLEQLLAAMRALKELAEKGDSTSSSSSTYYLDGRMIEKMNIVFVLLKNQGISLDGSSSGVPPLEAIRILKETIVTDSQGKNISFPQILKASTQGLDSSTKTLSYLIRYEFIAKGNELFLGKMGSLEEALQLSSKVLTALKDIENASNQFTVHPSGFKLPPESAEHIPPELVEDYAKAIYKDDLLGQQTFISQYQTWKNLPASSSQKAALSKILVDKVNDYLHKGTAEHEKLLEIAAKHFGPIAPTPNTGIPPKLTWPITSLFSGELGFPYPLPEDMLQELATLMNTAGAGYGDTVVREYKLLTQANRGVGGIEQYLFARFEDFKRRVGPAGEDQLHGIFQKYFDKFHPADPTLVDGKALLGYAKQLEEFINTLEKPPHEISRTEKNSLPYALDQVVKDINKAFEGVNQNDPVAMSQAMAKWITDNRDKGHTGGGGEIQSNLRKAMGAAQSLKDDKLNDLQEVIKKYDQFFQIATALMESLKKMAHAMLQGILTR